MYLQIATFEHKTKPIPERLELIARWVVEPSTGIGLWRNLQITTIRVWLKRDSGQYWPSIYHTMASPCSAMAYHHDSRRIFVGQDNGALMVAHQNRVSAIIFSLAAEWVISTGHDKCVSWMCTRSGNMLGRHFFASWASCLQYPSDERENSFDSYSTLLVPRVPQVVSPAFGGTPFNGYCSREHLTIASSCGTSGEGKAGHFSFRATSIDRVQSLCYLQLARQLVSCSSDGGIAVWNMDVSREEVRSKNMA
ncbi:hypothetical protein A6R68_15637, partial [Neotoma lepida]